MCGIVGYIGKNKALPILINGLKKLEYRGYDSSGIAYINQKNNICLTKSVGRISSLEQKLNLEESTTIGIGHTRWATHGQVTLKNSHPHQVGHITIVHNGIIENYLDLKKNLINQGYHFQSDTDTEVACAHLDYLYQKNTYSDIPSLLEQCTKDFEGSYAIVALIKDYPNQLFVLKKDSPLIIALGDTENFIASDISAYANLATKYISLEDKQTAIITQDKITIFKDNHQISPAIKQVDKDLQTSSKNDFPHYMLKEIYDQESLIQTWNHYYLNQEQIFNLPDISNYQKIHIIGCGTSYHAGLIGKYLLEEHNNLNINVYIASEYRYQKIFIDEHTLVIAISQSGETADTLACLKIAQSHHAHTLGIVNVTDSSIARLADHTINTKAGPEIAVASTKAYTAQLYVLTMLALRIELTKKQLTITDLKETFTKLPHLITNILHYNYTPITNLLWQQNNLFYLGRNLDYLTMLEGSLKLKEITYIHSEAMPAGELKHGTISLIDKNSCVIVLATLDHIITKTISNIKEIKARGAKVVLLTLKKYHEVIEPTLYDELIILEETSLYTQALLNIIPLQIIAYEIAKKRDLDIDKPRNLAKSVTVE